MNHENDELIDSRSVDHLDDGHRAAIDPAINTVINTVINEVRLLNNRLIELVEELHSETGISAPQRAVLEFVRREGPATVPTIARARGVTRQHIQTITNELRSLELAELLDNPAHQRSPMVALTAHGRDTIGAILDRERAYLSSRIVGIDAGSVRDAAATLEQIRHALGGRAQ
jgi:DNA-binding MarR family transcriptional regulator